MGRQGKQGKTQQGILKDWGMQGKAGEWGIVEQGDLKGLGRQGKQRV